MSTRLRLTSISFLFFIAVSCPVATAASVKAPPLNPIWQTGDRKLNNAGQQTAAGSVFGQVLDLLSQAQQKLVSGRIDEALALADRALKLAEKELGPEPGAVALALATVAQIYDQKSDYDRAESFYQRALLIAEKPGSGLEPSFIASTLINGLGHVYDHKDDFARAEPLYQRALTIQEKLPAGEESQIATTLTNLGVLYQNKGDYGPAKQLLERALAVREKTPAEPLYLIQSLKSLASLYQVMGEYEKAGLFLERAVAGLEKLVGADSLLIAPALSDLALHFKDQGDFVKAEQIYQRAIGITEKAGGPNAASLATPLDNLANLYESKGDYERAEALYKRALAIAEKSLGPENSTVATTLSNLAVLYEEQHKYAQAEPLFQRALAIKEKTLGPMHAEVGTLLSNMAVLYYDQGDYDKAESLSQRVLTIKEKALGPEHPDVAIALNNLAALKERRGDYQGAETFYLKALAIDEKKLGPRHPDLTNIVLNLALLKAAQGELSQALAYLTRGTEISEYNAALILTSGSEEQKRRYMNTLAGETDYTVSLHLRTMPNDLSAARLALTTILRRKGRALDAMTEQLTALRRHAQPQDRTLLEQLFAARSKLATLMLNGGKANGKQSSEAEQQAAVAKLEAEAQQLEAAVSARSAEFRAQSQPVTIASVQQALPADAALIEIESYRPYNIQAKNRSDRYGAPRYAAYVLSKEGQPQWIDLGGAAEIDVEVTKFRMELRNPRSTGVKEVGQELYRKIMRPLLPLVGVSRHLFLSPDGNLNLIPFGALVDEQGRYLIETYSVTYLTSGRDLLRLEVHAVSKEGPVIFANPLFSQPAEGHSPAAVVSEPAGTGRRSMDLRGVRFRPLPGTEGEAKALAGILSGVKVVTGAQATEAALKQVSGPSLLHIATHGFFLPDELLTNDVLPSDRGLGLPKEAVAENPLLRSGLALAGVNQRQSGPGEDGVLTALEAAGLDLWGTRLVVLSACETGLGEVRNGEGVYGLRRALVLAGSESQVMSLWQVSDAATRDLMTEYYRRLQAGEGRTEALRQVQIGMIARAAPVAAAGGKRGGQRELGIEGGGKAGAQRGLGIEKENRKTSVPDLSHPFYWAAFIQSGDWRTLQHRER